MVAAKRVHLDEIVGQLKEKKEEDPEGEELGESDTGSVLLPPFFFFINLLIRFHWFVLIFTFSLLS